MTEGQCSIVQPFSKFPSYTVYDPAYNFANRNNNIK